MKIVFCLPGKTFSHNFLRSWTSTIDWCSKSGIQFKYHARQGSNIYHLRSTCLNGDILAGRNQVPFQGKVDYDYIMWIDSDQVFEPEQIQKLINHNTDIVSGLYLMEDCRNFACVENFDSAFFLKNGYFKFLTPPDIKNKTDLIPVSFNGMGFMLIKKGVFETVGYPWFEPVALNVNDDIRDFCSEDASFCIRATKQGFTVFVDPTVVVGHEKTYVI